MSKRTDRTAIDLDLFATMVSRLLRERGCERPPARAGYSATAEGRYGEGRPDVRVHVDLGRGLRAQVEDSWIEEGCDDVKQLLDIADGFANAIEATIDRAPDLREIVREVRAAARSEVAKARRRGLPWSIVSVGPSPVLAGRVGEPAAAVILQIAGQTSRPGFLIFDAEYAEDVVAELDSIREEQTELTAMLRRHALFGTTGAIEAVLHADLVASGEDVPAILRHLVEADDWIVDLDLPKSGRRTMYWKNGVVQGYAALGAGVSWNDGSLRFETAPAWFAKRVVGRRLTSLFPNPVFERVIVSGVWAEPGGRGTVSCDVPTLLFDAAGRIRAEEPEALAT